MARRFTVLLVLGVACSSGEGGDAGAGAGGTGASAGTGGSAAEGGVGGSAGSGAAAGSGGSAAAAGTGASAGSGGSAAAAGTGGGSGSAGAGGSAGGPTDQCGDLRMQTTIFHGTVSPRLLPLTAGQIMAVGLFPGCSGTVISDRWVLTATHCRVRRGTEFCVGSDPGNADVCFGAAQVVDYRGLDLTLVELDANVSSRAPGVEPIPLMHELLDDTWIGRLAEAGGWGETENGFSDLRKFVVVPISQLTAELVAVNGNGVQGLCYGDSGGPLLVLASDGSVRVTGTLSEGDIACGQEDWYTRVDNVRSWIEGYVGATTTTPVCGTSELGRCVDGTAAWCVNAVPQAERCSGACGYDGKAFRCIDGSDACGGLDGFGRCDGDVARWCEAGVARSRDCAACGQSCQVVPAQGGVYCAVDPCADLDYLGRCNADTSEWCEDGVLKSRDCAKDGLSCGYVDDQTGYYCQ